MLIQIHRSTTYSTFRNQQSQTTMLTWVYIFSLLLWLYLWCNPMCRNNKFVILMIMTNYYWYGYYLGFLQCRSSHTIFYNHVPKRYVLKVHQQPTLGMCNTKIISIISNTCVVTGSLKVQQHSQLNYHCGDEGIYHISGVSKGCPWWGMCIYTLCF